MDECWRCGNEIEEDCDGSGEAECLDCGALNDCPGCSSCIVEDDEY